MQKRLINGPFKLAYSKVKKLRGNEKEQEYSALIERMNMYSIAEEFSLFYPKIYTKDALQAIADARNNIEAENILVGLRKAIV